MTAQPIDDPHDPQVICRNLDDRERDVFLRQYHEAVDAAHDLAGYQRLQQLLHVWSLTVIATSQPGYDEEVAAARRGALQTVPISEAIPDWAARLAARNKP